MNALISSTLLISSSAFTATAAEAIPLARMLPSPLVLNHSRGFGEWPDTISGNQTILLPVKPGIRDMRLKAVVSDLQSKNPLHNPFSKCFCPEQLACLFVLERTAKYFRGAC